LRALSLSTPSKSALNLLSPVVDQEPHLRGQASEAQVAGCCVTQARTSAPGTSKTLTSAGAWLERCVTDDAVLLDPTGRWEGVPGLAERIGR
jgi:hypothetical protein